MAVVASGGWIAATSRMRPWQRGHSRTSSAKTRCMSSAQASRRERGMGVGAGAPSSGSGSGGGDAGRLADGPVRGCRVGSSLAALPEQGTVGRDDSAPAGTTRSRSLAQGPRIPW